MSGIAAQKALLRADMKLRRAAFSPDAGKTLAAIIATCLPFAEGAKIAGVWPLPGEMDLRPALAALFARGHQILLPETPPRGQNLIFRRWTPGCSMVREKFGTYRPEGPAGVPDIVFVPLLAFDDAGNRLGYGGGFYDRTLVALPGCEAIGFAYAAQQVARVPTEEHDVPLRRIVTESGILQT